MAEAVQVPARRGPGRAPRRPRISARVVKCFWAKAATMHAQFWAGRHLVIAQLSCGHERQYFRSALLLVGEVVRCKRCESAADNAVQDLPWGDL